VALRDWREKHTTYSACIMCGNQSRFTCPKLELGTSVLPALDQRARQRRAMESRRSMSQPCWMRSGTHCCWGSFHAALLQDLHRYNENRHGRQSSHGKGGRDVIVAAGGRGGCAPGPMPGMAVVLVKTGKQQGRAHRAVYRSSCRSSGSSLRRKRSLHCFGIPTPDVQCDNVHGQVPTSMDGALVAWEINACDKSKTLGASGRRTSASSRPPSSVRLPPEIDS